MIEADDPQTRVPGRVVRAGPDDAGRIRALAESALPDPWTERAFAEELGRPEGRGWLAAGPDGSAGSPVGFLLLRLGIDAAEILSVGVDAPARRSGVGAALVRAALAEASRSRLGRVDLEVRASNVAAQGLYRSEGFVVVGRRPRYYPGGEDAVLMTCQNASESARPPIAAPMRTDAEVVSNTPTGADQWRMRLRASGWPGSLPGQFVMLSAGALTAVPRTDPLLPRPMAIFRAEGEEIEVLYKCVGRGTALLSEVVAGQRVGLVGPLGRGFPSAGAGRAILVGGGTGVASLYELAERERGGEVAVLLGAATAGDFMAIAEFEALELDLRLTTEDGSAGHRGLVTEALESVLAEGDGAATVFVCGPTRMMERCAQIAADSGARCLVSLENNMACGFGVCLGCAAPLREGGYALVCREGPVFDAEAIGWEGVP